MSDDTILYEDLDREKFLDCYWATPDMERFHHRDIDQLISERLAGDWVNTTITIRAMRPMTVPEGTPWVESLMEWLEGELEEYLDPEDAPPWPKEICDAAETFCSFVREYAPVWSCEEVARVEVDVQKWLRKNLSSNTEISS